jgi:beta-galactosidase
VKERSQASPGTIVCPWRGEDGKRFWIAVNMDGHGGEVRVANGAAVKLTSYEWRVLRE